MWDLSEGLYLVESYSPQECVVGPHAFREKHQGKGFSLAEVGHRNPQDAGVPPSIHVLPPSQAHPTALMESTNPLV